MVRNRPPVDTESRCCDLALGPALLGFSMAVRGASWVLGSFNLILKAVTWWNMRMAASTAASGNAATVMAAKTKIATASTWGFNAALLANPLTWIVLAIVAVVAALALLIWKFDWVRDGLARFGRWAWQWIQQLGRWLLTGLKAIGNAIVWYLTLPFRLVRKGFNELLKWAQNTGKRFVTAIWDGIVRMQKWLWDKVTGFFQKLRDMLPFSDARTGPLSDLTQSGSQFVRTFVKGIDIERRRLPSGVGQMLAGAARPLAAGPLPARFGAYNSGSGGPQRINRTVNITLGDVRIETEGTPEELAAGLADALRTELRAVVDDYDDGVVS